MFSFQEQLDGFCHKPTPTPDEKFKAWLKREGKMHKNPVYRFTVWLLDMLHDHYGISYTIETW